MSPAVFFFFAFASLAVVSAIAMVALVRNVVAAALSLVLTMVSLAGIFVLLGAEFLAAIQIMIYAGAIMVLLLFVIMLLDVDVNTFAPTTPGRRIVKGAGGALALGIGALLLFAFLAPGRVDLGFPPTAAAPELGSVEAIGRALFIDYVLPFEIAGLILLAAIVGAVILAKRRPG